MPETQTKAFAYKDSRHVLQQATMSVGQEVNDLRNRIAMHKSEARNLEARLASKEALYQELRKHGEEANAFVREQYEGSDH